MATKTQTNQKIAEAVNDVALQAGVLLMTAAASVGVVEQFMHHTEKKAVLPMQPAYATASQPAHDFAHNGGEMRREKEETHPHAHSYSVSQRTPARAGRA